MTTFPIVRIELEGMRHEIIKAFSGHVIELDAQVAAGVKRAVETFDIEAVIQSQATDILKNAVSEALGRVAQSIFYDDDIRKLLRQKLVEAMRK